MQCTDCGGPLKTIGATICARCSGRRVQSLRIIKPVDERFWAFVDKDGPIHPRLGTACWLWTGARQKKGTDSYGRFKFADKIDGAHRVAWTLTNGAIPDGKWVLHHCDNRPCVRPDHLFIGSCLDNERDKLNKGRTARGRTHGSRTKPDRLARGDRNGARTHPERLARGEINSQAKVTATAVLDMRRRYATGGATIKQLALESGLTVEGAKAAVLGRTWAHLGKLAEVEELT